MGGMKYAAAFCLLLATSAAASEPYRLRDGELRMDHVSKIHGKYLSVVLTVENRARDEFEQVRLRCYAVAPGDKRHAVAEYVMMTDDFGTMAPGFKGSKEMTMVVDDVSVVEPECEAIATLR